MNRILIAATALLMFPLIGLTRVSAQSSTPVPQPTLPLNNTCVLTTRTAQGVNVHSQPALSASVVGALDPAASYPVIAALQTATSLWYQVALGWVSKSAVTPTACDQLPIGQMPMITKDNPLPLTRADGFGLTLDKGSNPGQDTDQGYCSTSFALDFARLDGSGTPIHFAFGAQSQHLACLKLASDGQSFTLVPPGSCDMGQVALYCPTAIIAGAFGFVADQLTFAAAIQTPSPAGQPPPDPMEASLFFVWALPLPDHPGGAQNFVINWTPGSADIPGVGFAWDAVPAAGNLPEKQAALINFLPVPPNNTLPTVQHVTVDWFPNGFDPSVNDFVQVEANLASPLPGDPYGFTVIEDNQPLSGTATIRFELPTVP